MHWRGRPRIVMVVIGYLPLGEMKTVVGPAILRVATICL
jgi:hypothetical protein